MTSTKFDTALAMLDSLEDSTDKLDEFVANHLSPSGTFVELYVCGHIDEILEQVAVMRTTLKKFRDDSL